MINNLSAMRSRYDSGFSSVDRHYIEKLYASLLSKKVRRSGCGDCYRDAYIEIYSYLKREGKMIKKSNYVLKSGIIVHPAGTNKFYANAKIPDEVAEEYLGKYPQNIIEFAVYPADYLARVEARKNGQAVEDVDVETLKASVKALNEENDALKTKVSELNSKLEMHDEVIQTKQSLEAENSRLSSENKTLKAEVEALKAELAKTLSPTEEQKPTRKRNASVE